MAAGNIYFNCILEIWGTNSPIYQIYHEAEWSQTPSKFFLFPTLSYLGTYGQAVLEELHGKCAVSPNCITTYLLSWGLCLSSMLGTLGSITDSGLQGKVSSQTSSHQTQSGFDCLLNNSRKTEGWLFIHLNPYKPTLHQAHLRISASRSSLKVIASPAVMPTCCGHLVYQAP